MIQIDQDIPLTVIQGPLEIRDIAGAASTGFRQSTGKIVGTTTTPVNLAHDFGATSGDTGFIYVNNQRTDMGYRGNGNLLFVHDNEIVVVATVGDGPSGTTYAMSGGQVTIAFSTGTWDTNWFVIDPTSPVA